MFSVTVNLEQGYFETEIHGFWASDMLTDFGRAIEQAVLQIRATGRPPLSLCNYRGAMVQPQDVVAAFAAMMRNPAVRSKRVAVYTDAALPKMQAARANAGHSEFAFFTGRAEALAWLLSVEDAAQGR